jgi:hypothetical protein
MAAAVAIGMDALDVMEIVMVALVTGVLEMAVAHVTATSSAIWLVAAVIGMVVVADWSQPLTI